MLILSPLNGKHCHLTILSKHNKRINMDWQFRWASLPASYPCCWAIENEPKNY